ncbi:MAG: HEPN domain-containing protein [bacterium]
MVNINTVKGWLNKANHDMEVLKHNDLPKDIICFHAQQAVEKMLKAFLIYNDQEIQKFQIHDIDKIIKECSKINPEFEELSNLGVGKLTEYAVGSRYPNDYDEYNDFQMPSVTETKEAILIAEKVKSFVIAKINLLEQKQTPDEEDAFTKDLNNRLNKSKDIKR